MKNKTTSPCGCTSESETNASNPTKKVKTTVQSIGSFSLSLLIAFFPKCPICLAAYLSMFGSFGLINYTKLTWLFPLLLSFMALHLFFLFKKSNKKGYGPFLLSLSGSIIILIGRSQLNFNKWVLITGMLFILGGSLWNSFSHKKLSFNF